MHSKEFEAMVQCFALKVASDSKVKWHRNSEGGERRLGTNVILARKRTPRKARLEDRPLQEQESSSQSADSHVSIFLATDSDHIRTEMARLLEVAVLRALGRDTTAAADENAQWTISVSTCVKLEQYFDICECAATGGLLQGAPRGPLPGLDHPAVENARRRVAAPQW
jgi:hypothetical protein